MNIDPGQPIDREPLTPEERELAQRLSRLGPSAGPPSSVDARILAAAHEAVASRPRPKPRNHRRWPVALGVAASLTLAVGIAWRMRPEAPQYAAESAASAEMVAAPGVAKGPAPESDAYFSAQESKKTESEQAAVAKDAAKEQPKQEPMPLPDKPPIIVDEARVEDMRAPPPAAPSPPPPPPPAPVAAMSAPAADAAATGAAPSAQERERMSEAADAASLQRAKSVAAPRAQANEASDSRREAQSLDTITIDADDADDAGDEPPAYANSPEVREAWLRRVRELIVEGNQQQALDSLHEFQRRYPDHPLPGDLQRFQQSKTVPIAP